MADTLQMETMACRHGPGRWTARRFGLRNDATSDLRHQLGGSAQTGNTPVHDNQQLVGARQKSWPVRNHHDCLSLLFELLNRLTHDGLALGIQIGRGLV